MSLHPPVNRRTFGPLVGLIVVLFGLGTFFFAKPSAAAAPNPIVVQSTIDYNTGYATGFGIQRKWVRASTGTVALFVTLGSQSPSGLAYIYSRNPEATPATWSAPVQITSNQNMMASVTIDAANNILLLMSTRYSGTGPANVQFQRLTYNAANDAAGSSVSPWTPGPVITVAPGVTGSLGVCCATLDLDSNGVAWVAYRATDGTNYWTAVQHSTAPDFSTWSAAAPIDTPSPTLNHFASIVAHAGKVTVAHYNGSAFVSRTRNDNDALGVWGPTQTIETTGSNFHFSVAGDASGNLHFVYNGNTFHPIKYQKWTAATGTWGPNGGMVVSTLPSNGLRGNGQVTTVGNDVYVFTQHAFGNNQHKITLRRQINGVWDGGDIMISDSADRAFDRVWSVSGGTATDVTTAAANTAGADVKHATTGKLFANAGDALYLGMSERFDYVYNELQTVGAGGAYTWEYWNGSAWAALPLKENAGYAFRNSGHVRFNQPADWATTIVSGEQAPLYYVRATAATAPTTAPVGSQITAIKNNQLPTSLKQAQGVAPVVWNEGMASPYNVKFAAVSTSLPLIVPTPTNTPSPTNTPVVTPTNTPIPTPTNTPTPTATPTNTPTPTATPEPLPVSPLGGNPIVGMSTVDTSLGFGIQRKWVQASTGTVALFQQLGGRTPSGLAYIVSRNPNGNPATWSHPVQVTNNQNQMASVAIDANNNILLLMSERWSGTGTMKIQLQQLLYNAANDVPGATASPWTPGAIVTVTQGVNGSSGACCASLALDSKGVAWVAYRYFDGTNYQVGVQYSTAPDFSSWSARIPQFDTPNTNLVHFPSVVAHGGRLSVVYHNSTEYASRTRSDGDAPGTFGAAQVIEKVEGSFNFSVAGDRSGNLHVVYNGATQYPVKYQKWTAASGTWAASGMIVSTLPSYNVRGMGQVATVGDDVYVFTQHAFGQNQSKLTLRRQINGIWESQDAVISDPWERAFDRAWSVSGNSWTDVTSAATNATAADVKHATTGKLFANTGDALYVGMSQRFDYIYNQLGTNGAGGSYTWEYWNGSAWAPLTLSENAGYAFTTSAHVRFSPPADWTASAVNGETNAFYYVRVTAATAPTTAPVASQITAIKNNTYPTVLGQGSKFVPAAWTEGFGERSYIKYRLTGAGVALQGNPVLNRPMLGPSGPTGFAIQRKGVQASTGTVALFEQFGNRAPTGLIYTYSHNPGAQPATWSAPIQINSNQAGMAAVTIDANNNILLLISERWSGTGPAKIQLQKLLYNAANDVPGATASPWTPGPIVTITQGVAITTSNPNGFGVCCASLALDSKGVAWITYRYTDGTNFQNVAQYSTAADFSTWSAPIGLDTPSGSLNHFGSVVAHGGKLSVVYYNGTAFMSRTRGDGDQAGTFGPEDTIEVTAGSYNFNVAADASGNLHLVYNGNGDHRVKYQKRDATAGRWGPTNGMVVSTLPSNRMRGEAQVTTVGDNVYIYTQHAFGSNQAKITLRRYMNGLWDGNDRVISDPWERVFDRAWSVSGNTWTNVTTAAANVDSNDLKNAATGKLFANAGDALYVGMTERFDYVYNELFTRGAGGSYVWEYWNGDTWRVFAHSENGSYNFTASGHQSFAPPIDWAPAALNGDAQSFYYVRARALTAPTTASVGTQVTAIKNNNIPAALAAAQGTVPVMWAQGLIDPVNVKYSAISASEPLVDPVAIPFGTAVPQTATPTAGGATATPTATGVTGTATPTNTPTVGPTNTPVATPTAVPLPTSVLGGNPIVALSNDTNTPATGFGNQRKWVQASTGTVALFAQAGSRAPTGLAYIYSRNPGAQPATWSNPVQLNANQSAMASVTIDANNNILVLMSERWSGTGTAKIQLQKLLYNAANDVPGATASPWTPGQIVTIAQGTSGVAGVASGTIAIDGNGVAWVGYRYSDGTNYQNVVQYSTAADFSTWSSPIGIDTANDNLTHYVSMVAHGGRMSAVYFNGTSYGSRTRNDNDPYNTWGAAQDFETTVGINNYSAAGDASGNLHVVFNGSPYHPCEYRKWDAATGTWGANTDQVVTTLPSYNMRGTCNITTAGNDVYVFNQHAFGSNQYKVSLRRQINGVWDAQDTIVTDAWERTFDRVWSASAGSFTDVTTAAANTTGNDVKHATTGKLFANAGDALYVGMSERFDYIYNELTTAGAANTYTWEYWNGSAWTSLPLSENGSYAFTASGSVRFSPPANWTTTAVNGEQTPLYYVRVTAATAPATAPVSAQITAIKNNRVPTSPVSAQGVVPMAWTEGTAGNFHIKFHATAVSGSVIQPTPTNTQTSGATATPTNTPASDVTPTATGTPTNTPTATNTPAATNTPLPTPTATNTPVPTPTAQPIPTSALGGNAVVGISSQSNATWFGNQRKWVQASTGTVALFEKLGTKSPTGLAYVFSRNPNGSPATWSNPVQVSGNQNEMADVVIDGANNILMLTSEGVNGTGAAKLQLRQMLYNPSNDQPGAVDAPWTPGAAVTITQGAAAVSGVSYASLALDANGVVWVAYRYTDGTNYQNVVQYSTAPDLSTWSTPVGLDTASTNLNHFPSVVAHGGRVSVVYYNGTGYVSRTRNNGDPMDAWSTEQAIETISAYNHFNFSVASDAAGNLHLVYNGSGDHRVKYQKWDAATGAWGPTGGMVVSKLPSANLRGSGNVTTVGNDVYVYMQHAFGNNQFKLTLRRQINGVWEEQETIITDSWERTFDRVWSASADSWTDVTTAAANTTGNDVKHATTGKLFANAGDALYVGMSERFDYIYNEIFTKGAGGSYTWEYWNGSAWMSLPLSENAGYAFTGGGHVRFSPPADWAPSAQQNDPAPLYYVRVVAATAPTTRPVGSQITAIKNNQVPTSPEHAQGIALVAWTEGLINPFNVKVWSKPATP